MYNNGNTIKSSVMLLILNLLGGCESKNLQLSCCKFCIYTHPVNSKFTTNSKYTYKPIKDGSKSTYVNTKYQQQQTNNLDKIQ